VSPILTPATKLSMSNTLELTSWTGVQLPAGPPELLPQGILPYGCSGRTSSRESSSVGPESVSTARTMLELHAPLRVAVYKRL
jgi:hypothetical protein